MSAEPQGNDPVFCSECKKEILKGDASYSREYGGDTCPICWECAERMAKEAKESQKELVLYEEGGTEECKLCAWCGELFPESDLTEEVDIGLLCGGCIQAIESRGEELTLRH